MISESLLVTLAGVGGVSILYVMGLPIWLHLILCFCMGIFIMVLLDLVKCNAEDKLLKDMGIGTDHE